MRGKGSEELGNGLKIRIKTGERSLRAAISSAEDRKCRASTLSEIARGKQLCNALTTGCAAVRPELPTQTRLGVLKRVSCSD